jgi:hypothetical protein
LLQAQHNITQYLSGTDKDHTVQWDFFCTKGRNSGHWATIPVPSCWEQQGFGSYAYYSDNSDPEQGLYRHTFRLSQAFKHKRVWLVFEGSMTDTEVKINGHPAGDLHQGGFYEFRYDITNLVQFDTANLLEVTVSRHSANASVNGAERKADFWLFGGIFRPVYLEIVPSTFIQRVAIDARANGLFAMQVFARQTNSRQTIETQVTDLAGKPVAPAIVVTASDSGIVSSQFHSIKNWNPEAPQLYNAVVSIKEQGKTIHTLTQRFGFRTVELKKQDGMYVNGVKVVFKGTNRHSEWPETGRTLSRAIHLLDIGLIKGMNMNAVRMSHYPPDKAFLDLCDSLGLFVLDELTGWQAAYDTVVGRKLVQELVIRDVNHPSIVLWDNGNEGGWNRALDADYRLYDPQQRAVIHPWERFNGTNTKHYPDFAYVQQEVKTGKDIFFPTEFMHGLYDGGQGAALEDFWNEMQQHPYYAGGFLWSFHDEGIARTDQHNRIDVAGNAAPDGVVGPHREKEGSYYTIKELWSPVQINTAVLPGQFNGTLAVTNRYLYTSLDKCTFTWQLARWPQPTAKSTHAIVIAAGKAAPLSLAPGASGLLQLHTPQQIGKADVLYVTAIDAHHKEIFTWSIALTTPAQTAGHGTGISLQTATVLQEDSSRLVISCDRVQYHFSKATGFLLQVISGNKVISLDNGPSPAGVVPVLQAFRHYRQGSRYVVAPAYTDTSSFWVQWIFEAGRLPQLQYRYSLAGQHDYTGITFRYPEEKMTGMKWLGRGPYRVWKNRLRGQQLGVWQKQYNNTITGESWNYPEFKGWHSNLYWVKVQNREADFTIYTPGDNMYLQMLQPQKPKAAGNDYTSPPFPGNTIGFFNSIGAIGTKFQPAAALGPQSGKNSFPEGSVFTGSLFFDFK